MTDLAEQKLGFSSYHLRPDPEIHNAAWGGRLIYDEVKAGGSGVLWDRNSGWGDAAMVEKEIFPVVDEFRDAIRWVMNNDYEWGGPAERGQFVYRSGLTVVVGSPQGSYGYLYVTAAHERNINLLGQTKIVNVDSEDDERKKPVDFRTDTQPDYMSIKFNAFAKDYEWALKDKNVRFQAETLKKWIAFKKAFHRGVGTQGEEARAMQSRTEWLAQ